MVDGRPGQVGQHGAGYAGRKNTGSDYGGINVNINWLHPEQPLPTIWTPRPTSFEIPSG